MSAINKVPNNLKFSFSGLLAAASCRFLLYLRFIIRIPVRKFNITIGLLLGTIGVAAQTTYLPLHTEEYQLIDRLETLNGELSADFFTQLKPLPRNAVIHFLTAQRQKAKFSPESNLSTLDAYNIERAISISGEWTENAVGDDGTLDARKPILRHFYKKQPDLLHFNTDGLFLVVNPVLYAQGGVERNVPGLKYINTRGAEIRGRIFDRIGFYTMLGDNQEMPVSYVDDWAKRYNGFPGHDYFRRISATGNYDIFMARGYVDINVITDHLNLTFGYDKQYSGDGIRSLLISDYGAAGTFLRLRTRLGRFHYENLFLELTPDYIRGSDQRIGHKYAAIHQLNYHALPWLQLGVFESTMFGRANRFGLKYLVPVIGYNTAARALNADQKTSLGFQFKAIALRHLQFYGQAFFDQLKLSELGKGHWGNQYAVQLGTKYFDAFTLSNLDLQVEVNVVRPFMYGAGDGVTNHSHYNQPLAHPLGAGFAELIGVARYQPMPKLYISAKGMYALRGVDTAGGANYGNDVFKQQGARMGDSGYGLIKDNGSRNLYLNLHVAYEWRPNLFLEAGGTYLRRQFEAGNFLPSSTLGYAGLRWNIARRQYDGY